MLKGLDAAGDLAANSVLLNKTTHTPTAPTRTDTSTLFRSVQPACRHVGSGDATPVGSGALQNSQLYIAHTFLPPHPLLRTTASVARRRPTARAAPLEAATAPA